MKKILAGISIIFLLALTGCQENGGENGSYAIVVVINGIEYNKTVDDNEIDLENDLGKEIGTIKKTTDMSEMPGESQSNYYEVNSKIYTVKGTDEYIVIIDNNNEKDLLKKVKGFSDE